MIAYGDCLPDHVLQWVINSVDSTAAVQSVYQLKGSTSSTLHSITLKMEQTVRHYVIRRFDNQDWLTEEPDLAVHEAASLRMAEGTGVTSPNVIAFDRNGDKCGVPAVLMTKLDGAVELKPDNMEQWVDGLGKTLVKIHRIDAAGFPYDYFPYNDIDSFNIPAWSGVPEMWKKALDIVSGPTPNAGDCFIHRDYHPANVLWSDSAVSGVVDWVNACKGPRGVDIGHCRLNLAMLYGPDTADGFLMAYQHYAGKRYNRYWEDRKSVV